MKIFGLPLMALSKFAFLSSESTPELFFSTRVCWGISWTCNGQYKFWNSGTVFFLLLKLLLFLLGRTVVLSFHFFFLKSLIWFSLNLSIIFNSGFLSSWSFLFSSLRILTCSSSNSICSETLGFFVAFLSLSLRLMGVETLKSVSQNF